MKLQGILKQTGYKSKTINPIWNEFLTFQDIDIENINDMSTWPIALLQVKDKDFIGNDFIGYTYVWLSEIKHTINELKIITPEYIQLYMPKSNKPQGQILISAVIICQKTHSNLIDNIKSYNIIPQCEIYSFEINILGLRGLKPLSILPVRKPYICFDTTSINVTGETEQNSALRIIQTNPKDAGCDPTISTVIKFDVSLPINKVFMPDLQCVVYDTILSGLINSSLGIFLIDLNSVIKATHTIIDHDIKHMRSALNQKLQIPNIQDCRETTTKNDNLETEEIRLLIKHDHDKNEKSSEKDDEFIKYPIYKIYYVPGIKENLSDGQPNPKYQVFYKENKELAPNNNEYKAIGWNKNKNDNKKHYRRFFNKPLEDCKDELDIRSPFKNIPIRRGKYEDKSDDTAFFESMRNIESKVIKIYSDKGENKTLIKNNKDAILFDNIHEYGIFKSLIRVAQKNKIREYMDMKNKLTQANIDITSEIYIMNKFNEMAKMILVEKQVIINIYVLELRNLAKRDSLSETDPYVILKLGKQIINDEKNALIDEQSCNWYKLYE